MEISPLVELIPSRQECRLHDWTMKNTGGAAAEETYECLRCGAKWRRAVRYRRRANRCLDATAAIPPWPTWEDIIAEP